jgi:hypothetical protein
MPKYQKTEDVGKNWICKDCGSTDVEQEVFVNINTHDFSQFPEHNNAYCIDCSDEVEVIVEDHKEEEYEEQKIDYLQSVGGFCHG